MEKGCMGNTKESRGVGWLPNEKNGRSSRAEWLHIDIGGFVLWNLSV